MASVLFVDDEPVFLAPYHEWLLSAGHTVRTAANVADAERKLRETPYDLVVLDIMLPYVGLAELLRQGEEALRNAPRRDAWAGIELYCTVKKEGLARRVIIFSVLSEANIRGHVADVQYDCPFLQKGDPPERVRQTVLRALED